MAVRGVAGRRGGSSGKCGRLWAGCMAAVLMTLAGCSSGSGNTQGSPSGSSAAPPQPSAAPTSVSTTAPSAVYSDAELAAIINGVGQTRQLPFPPAHDSTSLRSATVNGSLPSTSMETTPADCLALLPQNPFARWADKGIQFAEGAMPPAGGQSGPTNTVMIVLRSAEKEAIATADFGYTDDLVTRCGQFDMASTEAGRTSTYAIQLLAAPPVADRQHAFMQVTKPKGPEDFGSVGLRVLAGTLSITLNLAVANLNSETDAKPALEEMAGLARELIEQSVKAPPAVAPPAPNTLTPEQLVGMFKGMTGPGGEAVTLPQATIIAASPNFTPAAPPQTSDSPCTFNDESYVGSLIGSVSGQGQIEGTSKIDYTDFTVVSMPSSLAPPFPFDSRADRLRGCTSIQESLFGGGSRTWSAVSNLAVTIPADASYAVAYQLSDGTGEWHVRSGARRGTLSVEASARTASQPEAQAKADALSAFFDSVFSRAGK